ncbi:MAG: hypothetical protein MJ197_10030 [Bacteroidales bacterium]|nr:hypothetical protein [Bacteroidales bacterium]
MTAKEYLQQVRLADVKMLQRINQLKEVRASISYISGIDYSKDRVQSTPQAGNKQIEKLVDLEAEVNNIIDETVAAKHKIINEIQSLGNADYIQLLYKRYIEYKPFETIASEMYLSYYRICHLHGEALKEFQQKVLC